MIKEGQIEEIDIIKQYSGYWSIEKERQWAGLSQVYWNKHREAIEKNRDLTHEWRTFAIC